ncbi:TRAP transporter substrate-binding protein [Jannaschia aquimarina]|uniref:YiaO_1 protein n=1 Tax=Jannaschia aquimarina TaxID=935700 RepID=A0A0D1DC40_9RHOB|nr:TRAP transporter substrate-binding protein [Jannaschia aquimarina]KIT17578.1 2,3-diketo-L-gulonate-binding periplasmic protein YiaO precursor [Jannaschia aquimarina]SNS72355.1 C4-dicarboxylate-binding protein DctP [Jannaschia aquimarina]
MTLTLTFGGYQGPGSVHTRGGHALADEVARRTGGQIVLRFQENVTDGGRPATDLLTEVEAGEMDGCYFASSYLAGRIPELEVLDQHFRVPDRAEAYARLDGALGDRLASLIAARTGFTVLGWWDNGFRHISAAVPLLAPEACSGLTIRTLSSDQHEIAFQALGFRTRRTDVRDLAAAVRDGTVDAQENPLTNIYNFGLHETHRHVVLTRHLLGVAPVLFNAARLAALSADLRTRLAEAVAAATEAQRRFATEDDAACAAALRAEGVTLHDLTDAERARFAAAVAPAVDRLRARIPRDLLALFDADMAPA